MAFSIALTSGIQRDDEGWSHARAEIVLDDYHEDLECDARFWSPTEYQRQWVDAVRLLTGGALQSRLVTSFRGPEGGYHFTWAMWREDARVFFQDQILSEEHLQRPFDPARAWDVAMPRQVTTAEGLPISEWELSLATLVAWVTDQKAS